MGNLKQIRLCGFGGQGVILAGTILGYAAVNDGRWASGSNSYGAQARGGAARSEVVISTEPIKFPHVIQSDILIALSQMAYDTYSKDVCEQGAVVIYDDLMVKPHTITGAQQIPVPATSTAIRELDSKQVANVVILGASVAITGIVSKQALTASIGKHVEERFKELNLRALEVGCRLGEDIRSA